MNPETSQWLDLPPGEPLKPGDQVRWNGEWKEIACDFSYVRYDHGNDQPVLMHHPTVTRGIRYRRKLNLQDALARIAELEARAERAEALNDSAICVFCGHVGPKNAQMMMDHVMSCEKHPLKKLRDLHMELAEEIKSLPGKEENSIRRDVVESALACIREEVNPENYTDDILRGFLADYSEMVSILQGELDRTKKAIVE